MILTLIIILAAFEIACFTTYGWFLNNKWIDVINTKKQTHIRLNTSTNNIFYIGDLPYIAKSFPSFFSKWYINGSGRVYRFSKLSHLLDEIYFDLITNKP